MLRDWPRCGSDWSAKGRRFEGKVIFLILDTPPPSLPAPFIASHSVIQVWFVLWGRYVNLAQLQHGWVCHFLEEAPEMVVFLLVFLKTTNTLVPPKKTPVGGSVSPTQGPQFYEACGGLRASCWISSPLGRISRHLKWNPEGPC